MKFSDEQENVRFVDYLFAFHLESHHWTSWFSMYVAHGSGRRSNLC